MTGPVTVPLLATAVLICAWLLLVYFTVSRARRARSVQTQRGQDILVVYASQTGTAKEMAQRTRDALGTQRAALSSMAELKPKHLSDYQSVLFIVSTSGEGDPPDMAQDFYNQALRLGQDPRRFEHLKAAVLALGDSSYRHYCGFGLALDQWLRQQGAQLLFDAVLADKCGPGALLAWGRHLSHQFQVDFAPEGTPRSPWRLARRHHLNPGSAGGACYELVFEPLAPTMPSWRAGDIASIEITPHGMAREYSIASIPAEGALHLIVRQHTAPNGEYGLGSHWLTAELPIGATVPLRIRENALFHAPDSARPAIFIGNGTGIAGLRSLLKTRLEQGHHDNWLIFGERQRAHDFLYETELTAWLAQQQIRRLDLAFSRDQDHKHYVHHVLDACAPAVRDWVARGAVIYICGSKDGMAVDVDCSLRKALGSFGYAALLERQCYRRDVY